MQALTPLMTIARRFERVTDQARNMCPGDDLHDHRGVFEDTGGGCGGWFSWMTTTPARARWRRRSATRSAVRSSSLPARGSIQERWTGDGGIFEGQGHRHLARPSARVEQLPNLEYAQVLVALTKEATAACLADQGGVPGLEPHDPSKVQGRPEKPRLMRRRIAFSTCTSPSCASGARRSGESRTLKCRVSSSNPNQPTTHETTALPHHHRHLVGAALLGCDKKSGG